MLRSASVLAGIDELSSPSGIALSTDMVSLMSSSSTSSGSSAGMSAQQIFEALVTDPRKSFAGGHSAASASSANSVTPFVPIDVPRGSDGKYLYWAPPMKPCDCGTPDDGRHIRDKWPCAYYRNPDKQTGSESPGGKGGKGGKGSKGGKGGKGGKARASST